MAETTHRIRMAMASKDDVKRLYLLHNVIENIVKYDATGPDDFDHFEEEEKKRIVSIFENEEINYEEAVKLAYELMWGFHRVVMGFEVLRDNCTDLELDHLDFNKYIKDGWKMLNLIDEKLKNGESITISPDSLLGNAIMEWAKDEEEEVENE